MVILGIVTILGMRERDGDGNHHRKWDYPDMVTGPGMRTVQVSGLS